MNCVVNVYKVIRHNIGGEDDILLTAVETFWQQSRTYGTVAESKNKQSKQIIYTESTVVLLCTCTLQPSCHSTSIILVLTKLQLNVQQNCLLALKSGFKTSAYQNVGFWPITAERFPVQFVSDDVMRRTGIGCNNAAHTLFA